MPLQVPIGTGDKFDRSKKISDHDKPTDKVQHMHHHLPLRPCWCYHSPLVPLMELDSREAEKAEDENLEDESADDDPLPNDREIRPRPGGPGTGCCEAASTALNVKRNNVAGEEGLCEARGPDRAVFIAMQRGDDATEHHIDGGGEKDWWKQDEHLLDDVGHEFAGVIVACDACGIAHEFHLARKGLVK